MTSSHLMNPHGYEIILASGSPRRQAFLKEMGLAFRIQKYDVEESYPNTLQGADIAIHITTQKANPFREIINEKQLVITADTIVWHHGNYLGKPKDRKEAQRMLEALSDSTHEVITAVGLLQKNNWDVFTETTKVTFNPLSDLEIANYIASGAPMDKAGAYGIQDRIGTLGIAHIEGSYTNVVGLPMAQLFKKLVNKLSLPPSQIPRL